MNTTQPQSAPPKATLTDRLLVMAIKRKNVIIPLVIAISLAAGGGLFWMQKTKADEALASIALSKAIEMIKIGEIDKAVEGDGPVKGLKGIAQTWGSTASGNMSRLYLAAIYFNSGKVDAALELYKAFNGKNKDLRAAALAGAASCHIQKKAFATAAPEFEKASETAENETLKAMYLKQAAECYNFAGKPDKAVELFVKVIRTWPGSSSAGVAQRTLLSLEGQGAQIPQL